MRRSDTSRACAFSAAVTVRGPRPRPGLLPRVFSGLVVCGLVFWEFMGGDAKCLLDSVGGRPAGAEPQGSSNAEVTSI